MKRAFILFFALGLTFGMTPQAGAVTDGTLDGNLHPEVVLLLMEESVANRRFDAAGRSLSPTVLLTAGHCTNDFPDEPYSGMRVFTESDVQAGIGITNTTPSRARTRWRLSRGPPTRSTKRVRSSSTMSGSSTTGARCHGAVALRHTPGGQLARRFR